MKNNKLSNLQKGLVLLSGILLVAVLFVPLWRIDFWAPQYPEGLRMLMYPNALKGDVEIINGLNHYIGMKTLHTEDFIEFTILPYLVSIFAAFCFLVFFINKRKALAALFYSFVVFGIVSMVDFYRWEYNYGNNLDPSAPIQIPGMSYTPPLIGYKQLLNFEVYSVPHAGGIMFFGAGILLLVAFIFPSIKKKRMNMKMNKKVIATAALAGVIFLAGCSSGPKPIQLGKDSCDYCKMAIADKNFGAEIITNKGKVYKFDDTHCLTAFRSEKMDSNDVKEVYLVNFSDPHNLIKGDDAILIRSDDLRSPMGGNTAAFDNEDAAKATSAKVKGEKVSLQEVYNTEK